jgi:hypothetical protein
LLWVVLSPLVTEVAIEPLLIRIRTVLGSTGMNGANTDRAFELAGLAYPASEVHQWDPLPLEEELRHILVPDGPRLPEGELIKKGERSRPEIRVMLRSLHGDLL